MKLRDILSIDIFPSAMIRLNAQCEENYYFYIHITEDSIHKKDYLQDLSDDLLGAKVESIVSYDSKIIIDVDISMVYIDRNEGRDKQ